MHIKSKQGRHIVLCPKHCKNYISVIALFLLLFSCNIYAQTKSFARRLPETEGVSAAAIDSFLNAASRSKNEFHSFMFLRHNKVIAEGWWDPYKPTLQHTLYSTSKSF